MLQNPAGLISIFSTPLLAWYDQYGRKDLPWHHPREPYHVWISEIMLQQTQVKTVIPYFQKFIAAFPSVKHLAAAPQDDVLALWAGLGYYSRARNLHLTAQRITETYQGVFPSELDALIALPGIGYSTAAAIISQAFNAPAAVLDANVKRVLCRYFLITSPLNQASTENQLKTLANGCMSQTRCADYTQAIMDLGATCCTSRAPSCHRCPLQSSCQAFHTNQVLSLPQKISKKPLPTKQGHFLIIENDKNQIYLVKRPDKGIWGGLWCLPEQQQETLPRECVQGAIIKHTFTHYHLLIQLWHGGEAVGGMWFDKAMLGTIGLPKPISQLLKSGL